jgi:hypothetical protein
VSPGAAVGFMKRSSSRRRPFTSLLHDRSDSGAPTACEEEDGMLQARMQEGWEDFDAAGTAPAPSGNAAARLVSARVKEIEHAVAPLRDESRVLEQEIESLRQEARRQIWETVVRTREIHRRMEGAIGRLGEVRCEIRDCTGEVRLAPHLAPFPELLIQEIVRFAAAS